MSIKNKQRRKKYNQKKNFMMQLEKEIIELEKKLKYIKTENMKIGTIRNLKISARTLQRIAPYVVSAGITAGGFKLIGLGLPFYMDKDYKYNLNIMKEYDNLGNIRTEEQYSEFGKGTNVLKCYSKWSKSDDGIYKRNVQTYSLEYVNEENIEKLLNEEVNVLDILKKPISNITETNNNLSAEEIEKEPFVQVIIYDTNKNDYIIAEEPAYVNFLVIIAYILLIFLIDFFVYYYRDNHPEFNYDYLINKIKKDYQKIDVEELTKKLEIRKSNYDRLSR